MWRGFGVLSYPAIAWKVVWSSNGYRGWDHVMYKVWVSGEMSGYEYVARYGFGHEWWNFYEGFSDEYYYGYAPPIHARRPRRFRNGGAIFFISKHPRAGWFLVGVYGDAEILEKPVDVGVLWDHIPSQYKGEILESTRKKLTGEDLAPLELPTYFILRARKDCSTTMPVPVPISLPEDIGVEFLGMAAYKYLELDRALALLDKAIEYVASLADIMGEERRSLREDPVKAVRRLRKLREHLVNLARTSKVLSQRPKPTIRPPHYRREFLQEDRFYGASMGLPERLIEEALVQNLEVIEEGLKFVERQVNVSGVGRIDILAYDKHEVPVVIEIKSGIADDSTLTQLLAYMSEIGKREGKNPRGIIVAEGFTRKLVHAVKLLSNIKLVRIAAKITIEKLEDIS